MRENQAVPASLLGIPLASLDEPTKKVARHIAERKHISKNITKELGERITIGQKAADAVATFGGSWTFVLIFAATIFLWVLLNSFVLVRDSSAHHLDVSE
jgi:uncharacterized membrane protein